MEILRWEIKAGRQPTVLSKPPHVALPSGRMDTVLFSVVKARGVSDLQLLAFKICVLNGL